MFGHDLGGKEHKISLCWWMVAGDAMRSSRRYISVLLLVLSRSMQMDAVSAGCPARYSGNIKHQFESKSREKASSSLLGSVLEAR